MSRTTSPLLTDAHLESAVHWYFANDWPGFGFPEPDWRTACAQMRDVLEGLARTPDRLVRYQTLVEGTVIAGSPNWHRVVSPMLRVLVRATRDAGLPMLTALVYGKAANAPGPGFHEAARAHGYQRVAEDDLAFWFAEIARVRTHWRGHG